MGGKKKTLHFIWVHTIFNSFSLIPDFDGITTAQSIHVGCDYLPRWLKNVFVTRISCLLPPFMASHSTKVIRYCESSLMGNTSNISFNLFMFSFLLALLVTAKIGNMNNCLVSLCILSFWRITVCTSCTQHNHAIKFLFPQKLKKRRKRKKVKKV